MLETYLAKPWLEITVGYQKGRLHDLSFIDPSYKGRREILNPILHCNDGEVTCHACPECGSRKFRKRHTMAKYIWLHRNCGKGQNINPALKDSLL